MITDNNNMLKNLPKRRSPKIIGFFILTAYLMLIAEFTSSKAIVLVTDIISGLSVIGIAILLFPYLKNSIRLTKYSYLFLKLFEGLLMIVGGFLFLSDSKAPLRNQIYDGLHLYIFIIGGFLFYWLLYKSSLVPRFISLWGFAAIFSLFLTTALKLLQITYPPELDYLLILIITNEVFLAVWLMIKGFKNQTKATIRQE